MMNPVFFTVNVVFMCAMMTFVPQLAFAFANASDSKGRPFWPVVLPKDVRSA